MFYNFKILLHDACSCDKKSMPPVWWAKLHVHTVECQYMSDLATPVVKQKRYYLSGLGAR